MIPAPLLLIAGPLIAAAAVYFIRRLTLVAALAGTAVAVTLAWLTSAVPESSQDAILGGWVTGGAHVILGRTLELSMPHRHVLIAVSLSVAGLLLLAARFETGGIFFPGLLALLGVTTAILVMETFVFQVLLVEVAVGVIAVLIQGTRFGSTRGAWRFFLFATLAMPLLLVAGWQIDFQAANPTHTELLSPAVLLLTLGFVIYLSAAPFHLWMAPAASEAEPLTQVVAFGLFPLVALCVAANAFEQFAWYAGSSAPYQWFTFLGVLTAGLGAILTFHAPDFGKLSSYSLLVDTGALLLLLGLRNLTGLQGAWLVLLLRVPSLVVWTAGLHVIRRQTGSDQIEDASGLGWQARLATAVLVFGGLSLAGFPLTPAFAGRWMALGLVARADAGRAALLLLGTASSVVGVLRAAKTLLNSRPEVDPARSAGRWGWLTTTVLAVVVLGAVILALFPDPLITYAGRMVGAVSYPR